MDMDGRAWQRIAAPASMAVLFACAIAPAQTARTGAAPAVASTAPGNAASGSVQPARPVGLEDRKIQSGAHTGGWSDWWRTLAALAVVVGLIFLLRFVLRNVRGPAGGARSGAIQVLARATVAPRQQVIVVRVGSRVLVLGSGPGGLVSLCQLTDPEEVAHLAGALEQGRGEPLAGLFRRKTTTPGQEDESDLGESDAGRAARDLAGKIRSQVPDREGRP